MRTADLTTALILMAGGVLVIWDSLRLGIGWGTDGPESGFFPFWLAVLLMVSCAAIGLQAWRRASLVPFVTRARLTPVLTTLLPATGFAVVTVSVLFPLVIFVVFEKWFLVPMPKGPLESWLGY